jgi:signal-transduction protein with cAMP-binding, CBS, and nucleotidyltransferase domain
LGDADILEAASLMLRRGVHHLVVEMPAEFLGIISMREITAILLHAVKPDVWMTAFSLKVESSGSETPRI